jgi:hypothetical protein
MCSSAILPLSAGTQPWWNCGINCSPGTAVARALHGMGGVGKTQLAVEYAYRFSGTFELVWWITAERTELIAAQLADLAVETGVAVDTAEIPGAVSALYSDLRRRNGWLLIFDNAEDPRTFQQWLPSGPGHVLITSRNPNWGEIAEPVNVAEFAAEESVTLLRRRVPGISVAAAEHIAVELGNFPLALAQAASVLSETGLPAAVYLEHLASRASETLAEGTPAFYSRSLAATVSDAADRLGGTDPAAAALLRLSASFGPEPILRRSSRQPRNCLRCSRLSRRTRLGCIGPWAESAATA